MTFLALAMSHSAYAQQRQIFHVDISGSWYHVYDTSCKLALRFFNGSILKYSRERNIF